MCRGRVHASERADSEMMLAFFFRDELHSYCFALSCHDSHVGRTIPCLVPFLKLLLFRGEQDVVTSPRPELYINRAVVVSRRDQPKTRSGTIPGRVAKYTGFCGTECAQSCAYCGRLVRNADV